LRINEALGIHLTDPTGTYSVFDAPSSTIYIKRGLFRGREQDSPKTPSAIRSVEVPYALSAMLAKFAGSRSGYLFGNGTPTNQTTARNQLVKQGLPGFHSFRRYFISYRRSQGMPEELLRSLAGHASSDVTSRYSRFGTSAAFAAERREWVEKIGLGFKLPR
jgi:integrase